MWARTQRCPPSCGVFHALARAPCTRLVCPAPCTLRAHSAHTVAHTCRLAVRYDPYGKVLTRERYGVEAMKASRQGAIRAAAGAKRWGIILGTLGRQGNPAILGHLQRTLRLAKKQVVLVLLSEVFPAKLALFGQVEAWVQVACPRLSIDWGAAFVAAPLLTPYEALVCLGETVWRDVYPMDYYAEGGGPWTNMHHASRDLNALAKTAAGAVAGAAGAAPLAATTRAAQGAAQGDGAASVELPTA